MEESQTFPLVESQGLRLASLGGQNPARKELQGLVQMLKQGQAAPFSSYLLQGSTGSGKTTLARALAGELFPLGIKSFHAEAADFVQDGPQKLKSLFAEARAAALESPSGTAVVLIDEIEALARIRTKQPDVATAVAASVAGLPGSVAVWAGQEPDKSLPPSFFEQHQLLVTLTSEMDKSNSLILLGTTSRSDTMDYEASNRFQRKLDCPTPSGPEERLSILQSLADRKRYQVDPEVLEEIAAATPGDNPGKLENNLRTAAALGGGQISSKSAREARLQEAFGVARPVTNPDWMWRLTICHEIGHVVVRHLFESLAQENQQPDHMPKGIDAVSFAPRGPANAAVFLKTSNNPASTFEWYMAEISSNLAGRAAEAAFGNGHLSGGPGSDIRHATQLTSEAVREKGMGFTLGPVNAFNSPTTEAQAKADEERIREVSDRIGASCVNFYHDFIENYAAKMLTQRENLDELTVSGKDLKDQLAAWEQADPQRSQDLANLKAQIAREIAAIKAPAPQPLAS